MPQRQPQTARFLLLAVTCVAAVGLALPGCDREPDVVTYLAPRDEAPPARPAPPMAALPGSSFAEQPEAMQPQATFVPQGWTRQPQPAAPRLMAFDVADGDYHGTVTVTRFGGTTGNLLANLNRWRRQVQLPPIDDPDAQDFVGYPTGVDPAQQIRVYRMTDEAAGDDAPFMLVLRVPDMTSTWFVKLTGQRGMRAAQTDNFLKFIDGLQLPLTLPEGLAHPDAGAPKKDGTLKNTPDDPAHDDHMGHDHD